MRYYTLTEATKVLPYSSDSLRVMINREKIKGIKRGRDWFISSMEVIRLNEELIKPAH